MSLQTSNSAASPPNVVKLITNQIWFINAAAIGEGLVLGKKAGVDLLVLWEALKNSVGDTFVVRHDELVEYRKFTPA